MKSSMYNVIIFGIFDKISWNAPQDYSFKYNIKYLNNT